MKILDRLPMLPNSNIIRFGQHQASFHRNSIIVWISVALRSEQDPKRISPPFPALLDSGNNCEAYLHENHLTRWAGIEPASLPELGFKKLNKIEVSFRDADIWIHPNVPGRIERSTRREPFRLPLDDGMAVGPSRADQTNFPRVPLIGFSALFNNGLDYWFDSKSGHSYLRTASWRSRIIRSLCRFF
jgi:hypothetical protein